MIVNDHNEPSLRGIKKVGFKKTGFVVDKDFLKRQILREDLDRLNQ